MATTDHTTPVSPSQRIYMADWAKAAAICLVIMSHTAIARPVAEYAFMVEIPLFFFLSGYLFRFDRNPKFGGFLKKRFRQIMVPYFTINAVTYLFWLLVARHFGADAASPVSPWEPLLGIVLSDSTMMPHNATMYFFTTLFNIEIAYYLLFKGRKPLVRLLLTLLILLLGAADYRFIPSPIPFSVSHAIVGTVFYSLGNETRRSRVIHTLFNSRSARAYGLKILAAVLLFAFAAAMMHFTGALNLQKREYSVYPLYFVVTLAAIFAVLLLCSLPRKLPHAIRLVSENTLWLCGYHLLVFTLLKGVMLYGFGIRADRLTGTIMPNILFALAAMAVCLCATLLIKRIYRKGK